MGKLNQVIAVVNGKKKNTEKVFTDIYHRAQKVDLFNGLSRAYRPKDDEGERLPAETKLVQVRVLDLIDEAVATLSETFDIVATQDYANCSAKADVEVGGKIILRQVPATHLLFLEKQLTDLATFVSKLPTLDPSEEWSYDTRTNSYATKPTETTRTKKIPKAFEASPATDKHPAQVQVFTEDVVVGYWSTVKLSGAIPASMRYEMAERVRHLKEAVVKAREAANGMEVTQVQVAKPILDYVFQTSAVSS